MANLYCSPVTGNIDVYKCGMTMAGLKGVIYFANFGEIDSITSSTTDNVYDAVNMKTDPLTASPYFWYQAAFNNNTAGITNTLVVNDNGGYVEQLLQFSVNGLAPEFFEVLNEMASGEMVAIAQDQNGNTHLLGRVNGIKQSEGVAGTGAALGDLYGATLSFMGSEPEYSNFIAVGTTIEVSDGQGGITTVTF